MKRFFAVAALVTLASLGVALRADAQTAVCSRTHVAPGGHIGVTGDGAAPGETVSLEFNGSTIGAGTADGFGNFALSGTIPASATAGLYPITVTATSFGTISACTVTVEEAAPVPGTPAPTATSTATQAPPSPSFIAIPVVVQQQQQQQQQQQLPAPEPRSVPEPRFVSSGRSSLPTTGAATAEMAQGGTGILIIGIALVEFARRRKRGFTPAASTPTTMSEGDLFLPFWPHD